MGCFRRENRWFLNFSLILISCVTTPPPLFTPALQPRQNWRQFLQKCPTAASARFSGNFPCGFASPLPIGRASDLDHVISFQIRWCLWNCCGGGGIGTCILQIMSLTSLPLLYPACPPLSFIVVGPCKSMAFFSYEIRAQESTTDSWSCCLSPRRIRGDILGTQTPTALYGSAAARRGSNVVWSCGALTPFPRMK